MPQSSELRGSRRVFASSFTARADQADLIDYVHALLDRLILKLEYGPVLTGIKSPTQERVHERESFHLAYFIGEKSVGRIYTSSTR